MDPQLLQPRRKRCCIDDSLSCLSSYEVHVRGGATGGGDLAIQFTPSSLPSVLPLSPLVCLTFDWNCLPLLSALFSCLSLPFTQELKRRQSLRWSLLPLAVRKQIRSSPCRASAHTHTHRLSKSDVRAKVAYYCLSCLSLSSPRAVSVVLDDNNSEVHLSFCL